KTTRLPLALLNAPWRDGRIVLLEPRRIAARLAAERMASSLGEKVGQTIGLSTRVDRRVSDATRIEVITDGLFTRRILSDPELDGISAVLFDEFHERSINIDLGLALALEAQTAFAENLRVVVMSATLNVSSIASKCASRAIETTGRSFPIKTIYLGKSADQIDQCMEKAVLDALSSQEGSILAFLPGRGEIEKTAKRLESSTAESLSNVQICPLYGAMPPHAQDAAVSPPAPGTRKVVLATDIAESSLTIEGVRIVIDGGLSRRARVDAKTGESQLVTERASLANVDQRRGRAGRTEPGVCYRLWREAETQGLPAFPPPEILTGDLTGLVMALAEWGAGDPASVPFIDPPPKNRFELAQEQLRRLGALDLENQLTTIGRRLSRLPLEPRLAAIIARAESGADRALASRICALISEQGLGGHSTDLRERLARFANDTSTRAKTLRRQAADWAGTSVAPENLEATGAILARGTPGMIAKRVDQSTGKYLLANGRGAHLSTDDPLSAHDWLAVAQALGTGKSARILSAAPIEKGLLDDLNIITVEDTYHLDQDDQKLVGRRLRRIGAIVLSSSPLPRPVGERARRAFIDAIRAQGIDCLEIADFLQQFQARWALAAPLIDEDADRFSDPALLDRLDDWALPQLKDPTSLSDISAEASEASLLSGLDWGMQERFHAVAPKTIELPSGRRARIDYQREGGPTVSGKTQEFYGLNTPLLVGGGSIPLVVELLSPAGRQVALTRDLPSFWTGGYADMAKDMRARYPKHHWPDDPANEAPHEGRTKARLASRNPKRTQ
ncbi:MAG: ATP-dependent helicase HrpB, partial [Pseudomonadota bacterium]